MADGNSTTVQYRDIPGFPGYRVGDDGSVWSCWHRVGRGGGYANRITEHWRQLTLSPAAKGYLRVNLVQSGRRARNHRVHRLILEAFVGPCPMGMECRHLNGTKTDNRWPENIVWGTPEENCKDNRRLGVYSDLPRNRRFAYDGKTMCLKEWAHFFGIPYQCLYQRVNKLGMSFEEAVTRPYHGVTSNGGHWKGRLKTPVD